MPCKICGKEDDKKPMCFRGERWCSEAHHKLYVLRSKVTVTYGKVDQKVLDKLDTLKDQNLSTSVMNQILKQ